MPVCFFLCYFENTISSTKKIRSVKKIFSLALFSIFCSAAFCQLACNKDITAHLYKPERLTGEKKCTTIKGMVREVKELPDGGYRVLIKLDPGQPTAMLNDKNISLQKGCMVVEIICAHRPITNPEAVKSCGSYENKIKVPALNDHLQITGTLVTDSDADHGWAALYPVSEILELQKR